MPILKEAYQLVATTADILAAPSRLAAIPAAGSLTIEMSSTDCDATNYAKATLQLPDGSVPFEDLLIPYNGVSTTEGTMKNDTALVVQFGVQAGGHVLVSLTENGTVAGVLFIFTLTF